MSELRHQQVTRFIMPLREGGSLPVLAEADDDFKYVVKMRGAGHGAKALIAELIGGEIARKAGLRVPELIFLDLDEDFGRTEPDEEVQDLLKASRGLNLGMHFLSGAVTLDSYLNRIDSLEASKIVWLDSYLTNVDRTTRNTNMLIWHSEPWLIDHGASLMFHHSWKDWEKSAASPFPYIKDHALLHQASKIEEASQLMLQKITPADIEEITALIPDEWLVHEGSEETPRQIRQVYTDFLTKRLEHSPIFTKTALDARQNII
ncbi:MAG: aminotransferase class I and II [Paramuribaculum sp.]|nr:aminotransferase class I and II [Paramuribaculum sp.]